jgi:hypothetical protein
MDLTPEQTIYHYQMVLADGALADNVQPEYDTAKVRLSGMLHSPNTAQ